MRLIFIRRIAEIIAAKICHLNPTEMSVLSLHLFLYIHDIGEEYKIAIVLALALLFTFYVVSFAWITVFDWWR